ncbi:PAS domain S-box protein [Bacteroidota bacterium]
MIKKPTYDELVKENEILRQSEEGLREVFKNMSNGVCFYDVIDNGKDFIFCDINKAGEEIANVKKSDILGTSLLEVRPNIEEYGLIDVFKKVWKTGKPEILDDKYYDDQKLTGYFKNFVYKSSSGKIVAIFENLTEGKQAIQELKKAKEKAEESESKFRTLFETIPLGITLADNDGQIISSNPAAEIILGLTKEEQLQRSIDGVEWSIVRPDGTLMPPEEYASTRALNEQRPITNIEMGITKEINKVAWINVNAAPIKDYGVVISYEDVTKRKMSEIELIKAKEKAEKSEEQLKLIANNFVNGMIYQVAMLDEDKRKFTYVSETVMKLYNCTPEEAMSNPDLIYGKLHPEDIDDLIEKEKEALLKMSVFKTECRVINPDGSIRWSYYVSQPRIINGLVCWDGIEVDITERKEMEFALKSAKEKAEESQKQFMSLFEQSPLSIQIFNSNGITINVNQAWRELWQVPNDYEIINKYNIFKDKHAKESGWLDYLVKAFEGETVHIPDMEYDPQQGGNLGRKRVLQGTTFPIIINKKVENVVLIHQDVTDLKKNEAELIEAKEKAEESESKFRTLFETIPLGITMADKNGQIISSNPAAENILGLTKEEQLQRSIDGVEWSIVRPDGTLMPPEEYASTRALHEQRPITNIEMGITKEINKVAWINVNAAPIKDYGVVISYEDVTVRKIQEENILRSNKQLQLINDFTSEILKISKIEDIYKFITVKISELFPNTIVLCNSIDEKKKEAIFQSYSGINSNMFNKILSISGFNPVGKTFNLVASHEEFLRTGRLQHFTKGLAEFSESEFPEIAAKAIEKLIGISNIYSIGISKENNLIASLQFFSYNKSAISAKEFIETFVYHAGIVLQKKILELQLTESEAKHKMLTEFSGDMIVKYRNFKMVYVNPAVEKILGYTKEEYLDFSPLDLIHPDDIEEVKATRELDISDKTDKNHLIEFRQKHKNGSYRWISAQIIIHKIDENNIITIINSRDVTSKKEDELKIKKLSTAVSQSPTAIVITNTKGDIEYANSSYTSISGYSYDELIGQNPRLMKSNHHKPEFYKNLWETVTSGNIWKGELYNKHKNGSFFWESSVIAPIFNQKNELINFVAVKQNITERKLQENLIKQQNKELTKLNADKDRFMQILAHDLKNPFHSILGLIDLLKDNIREYDIDEVEELLNLASKSAQNTFHLLENLLTWGRSNSGEIPFEPQKLSFSTSCNEVIENLQLTANTKSVTINYVASDGISIFADKKMLKTILRNLISNAIKFTNKGGQVNIHAEQKNSIVTITISDNGIGIEPSILNKLFDISEKVTTTGTANEKGTGLGLLLCKEFAEKHEGKIWVESEVGKGSNFKFTLPLNQ